MGCISGHDLTVRFGKSVWPIPMYTPPSGTLVPGALYARAMQASNGKMYATFEQYTTGVASFPIFESTDSGRTWTKVGDVKDTHKGVGMRWEPQLYQLPQAISGMPEGTALCCRPCSSLQPLGLPNRFVQEQRCRQDLDLCQHHCHLNPSESWLRSGMGAVFNGRQ
jgi:hypothetical protein